MEETVAFDVLMKIYSLQNMDECLKKIAYRNKYDKTAGEVSKEIFQAIVYDGKGYIEIERENLIVKVSIEEDEDRIEETNHFNLQAIAIPPQGSKEVIVKIDIVTDKDFSLDNYERLNFLIYEVVRHELEHANQFFIGRLPDESYKEKYDKTISPLIDNEEGLRCHVNNMATYILSNEELPAYARSIVYIAKKQNKDIDEVIRQIFNRAFFNNRIEIGKKVLSDPEMNRIVEDVKTKLKDTITKLYPKIYYSFTYI